MKNKDAYVNLNDISPKFYGNPNDPRNAYICYKSKEKAMEASIKKVIFNNPATIVLWEDGTKTVVKAGPYDIYDPEKGLAMCLVKKQLGNKGNYYELFKKYLPKTKTMVFVPTPFDDDEAVDVDNDAFIALMDARQKEIEKEAADEQRTTQES